MSLADVLPRVLAETPSLPPLTPEQEQALVQHGLLLERWNRVHNLTRVTDPEAVARTHFLDSLLGLSALQGATPSGWQSLLDIGSGGGFPGLVAAVLWPERAVTLVDSVKKKASFLSHVAREVPLANVRVVPQRAESLTETAEVVTTRATLPWEQLPALSPLVAPGGCLAAWVAEAPSAEEWAAHWETEPSFSCERLPYEVPGLPPRALALARRHAVRAG